MAEVKFCGLTRASDARWAGKLGAGYIGVIFAGGPRLLSESQAREVLDAAGSAPRRVGVFGVGRCEEVAARARRVGIDVVQLHYDVEPAYITALRAMSDARIWAVVRTAGALPPNASELFEVADAVVLDARVEGGMGGSGVVIPWQQLAGQLQEPRKGGALVLAGGLTPENLAEAIATLVPDVVDVSSGVESAPGIKDHGRMRAFAAVAAQPLEKR